MKARPPIHLEIQRHRKSPVGILRTTFRDPADGKVKHKQHGRRKPRRPPRDQVGAPASCLKRAIFAISAQKIDPIQTADVRGAYVSSRNSPKNPLNHATIQTDRNLPKRFADSSNPAR